MKPSTHFRGAILASALAALAFAQSSLTTIQDTLFKADGTRFTGTLYIQWNTFDTANPGTIVQQSRNVPVVNGNLQVQLVPNSTAPVPANVYTVHYQSDGRQQFTETWTVPPSAKALTVAQVRTGTVSGSGNSGGGSTDNTGNTAPILESTVIGLVADLAVRPVKGPGFGTSSVAIINESGQVETAVGSPGDCVFVDGTAGPCGSQGAIFFDAETPGGLVDGTNVTFTLANPPSGSSLSLYRNGLYMKAGVDYTLTNSSFTFLGASPPEPGDTLIASYRLDPSTGNIGQIQGSGGGAPNSVVAQVICSNTGRSTSAMISTLLGSCDLNAAAMQPGDRIEIKFNFVHTGTLSGFDFEVDWGTTQLFLRHGNPQDAGIAGHADAGIGTEGAQIGIQTWGTVLNLLPTLVSSPIQQGITIRLKGLISSISSDALRLASYSVLRYPGF
ncbi:MAG: hypothetical protein ABJC09_04675 [Terriglobia bacterium]